MSDENRKSPSDDTEQVTPAARSADEAASSTQAHQTETAPQGGVKDVPAETAAKADNVETQPSDAPAPKKPAKKVVKEKPAVEGATEPVASDVDSAEKPAAAPAATTEAPAKAAAPAATTDAAAPAKPAAPAKKAPPPPDPRAEEAKAKAEIIKAAIVAKLGEDAVEEVGAAHFKPMVRIRKEDWLNAVELLGEHEDWQLNYIECMAGADYPDYIEIVIYIQSTALGHFVCLKTRTERENAEVPSLVSAHPGVNWEEREIYDLLGVTFTAHPDLRRIMMWDEFKGHPLRKDYSEWD